MPSCSPWVLLLATSHSSFLTPAEQVRCAANLLTFLTAYNCLASDTLQHYVYQRLQFIFSEFSDVGHVFIEVDSAQPNCATLCWEAILNLFPLDSVLLTHLQLAQCVQRAINGPKVTTTNGVCLGSALAAKTCSSCRFQLSACAGLSMRKNAGNASMLEAATSWVEREIIFIGTPNLCSPHHRHQPTVIYTREIHNQALLCLWKNRRDSGPPRRAGRRAASQ